MTAHAMIGPLTDIFLDKTLIKPLINNIKAVDIDDFYDKFRNHDQWSSLKYNMIKLQSGEAFYLYGGRKALLKKLAEFVSHNVCVMSPTRGPMALYRAQITVASGFKAKQLLILTDLPNPLDNNYLVPTTFSTTHFTRISELQAVINDLKPL